MNSLIPKRGGAGLLDEMRRDFDSIIGRYFGGEMFGEEEAKRFAWTPRVDVCETDKALVVKADLPGVAPEDLEVTLSNGLLTLRGERREESKEEKETFRRSERFVGRFSRVIPLPEGYDAERIAAQASKGVVTVTIPLKSGAQPRKIAINAVD
jgi:HSP20 family protein